MTLPADDSLARAKQLIDLPQLMQANGVRLHKTGPATYSGFCPFHRNSRTEALSLIQYDWGWHWQCNNPACGEHGSVIDYIARHEGISDKQACRRAIEMIDGPHNLRPAPAMRVISRPTETLRPITQDALTKYEEARERLSKGKGAHVIKARGLTHEQAVEHGLGVTEKNDLLIPCYDQHGELTGIKVRFHKPINDQKYTWLTSGRGAPPWISPNTLAAPFVLLTEGELNGIAAWEAIRDRPAHPIAVIGMGSASSRVRPELVQGRDVYIYADPDEAGLKALQEWPQQAFEAGARSITILDSLDPEAGDFSDFLRDQGRDGLWLAIDSLINDGHPYPEPEQPQEGAFNLQLLDATNEPAPIQWVVEDMIPKQKITIICADGAVGKSSLVTHLAVCISHKQRFLGRWTNPTRIAYLDWEDDQDQAIRWLRRCELGAGVPLGSTPVLYVNVPSRPNIGGKPFHLTADELIKELGTEHTLIIIDAMEPAFAGLDMNKAQDTILAMAALKKLVRAGHTVVALDHVKKLSKGESYTDLRPQGSVQKTNQSRSVILLEKVTPPGSPLSLGIIKVKLVKLNIAAHWEPFGVERRIAGDPLAATFALCELPEPAAGPGRPALKSNEARELILGNLASGSRQHGTLVTQCEQAGISERTAQTVIAELEREGRITRSGGTGRGSVTIYSLKRENN